MNVPDNHFVQFSEHIEIEKKNKILVTTLTKKMAEELTEYYANLGVKVRYMHSEIDTIERVSIIRSLKR